MRISDWSSDVCSSDLIANGSEQDRSSQTQQHGTGKHDDKRHPLGRMPPMQYRRSTGQRKRQGLNCQRKPERSLGIAKDSQTDTETKHKEDGPSCNLGAPKTSR